MALASLVDPNGEVVEFLVPDPPPLTWQVMVQEHPDWKFLLDGTIDPGEAEFTIVTYRIGLRLSNGRVFYYGPRVTGAADSPRDPRS
jgi:hypothetical protein